jgi:hypothetical protein
LADTNVLSTASANMDDVPMWMQAAGGDAAINYTGYDDRGLLLGLLPDEGILGNDLTSFVVTQRGAGANFSVDVAVGQAAIKGVDGANQGMYKIRSIGTVNVATPTAPVSGTRVHRLVAQVRDKQVIGSGTYDWQLWLREDTGTGTPALPNSAINLALISIASGQASVLNANITDLRVSAAPPGTLLAENIRSSTDQSIAAGGVLIIQSLTVSVSALRKYLLTWESRASTTNASNAVLLTFKAATGASVTTGAADVSPIRSWGSPTTANISTPTSHTGIWTPASTGQWTVGFCVNFYSGLGTMSVGGSANEQGVMRMIAAR